MRKFTNMKEIKQLNRKQGHYFFSPDTMRFFNSEVYNLLINGIYFVTSEQFDSNSKRKYTLRMAMPDGSIETIGGFHAHDRSTQAYDLVNDLPDRLQEAMVFFNKCWKNDEMQKFIDHARTEPENNKDGFYSMDTFCGACSWMMENPELLNDSCLTRVVEDYNKEQQI